MLVLIFYDLILTVLYDLILIDLLFNINNTDLVIDSLFVVCPSKVSASYSVYCISLFFFFWNYVIWRKAVCKNANASTVTI